MPIGGRSRSAVGRWSRRSQPSVEALQIYSLLQTIRGAVSQVEARLRIFCSPWAGQPIPSRDVLSPARWILVLLRPTYEQELEALGRTYEEIQAWDVAPLRSVVSELGAGPAGFIGSGGMTAVAVLASQLHERACLQPGAPMTPLAALSRPPIIGSGAVLFTSSGKHPDAREVMRRIGRTGSSPAAVLTHRPASELPEIPKVAVVTLPELPLREGFLAVNSVLSMGVALVRAYVGDVLPGELPSLACSVPVAKHLLVLYGPELAAVASDLEARIVEIGLASVQLADYRNFAHGRHVGLQRNLEQTAVLALSTPASEDLADATLAVLPAAVQVARWHADIDGPAGVLALLVASMRSVGELGTRLEIDLAHPRVPMFGRRLYRLPIRRRIAEVHVGPVERKLGGVAGATGSADLRRSYQRALDGWLDEIESQRFGAIVLDYDGTVCSTKGRFDPPQPAVGAALSQVLDRGLRVGLASGRGPSLHRALRDVVDPRHWSRVEVGLYNGGVILRLDEEPGDLRTPSALIAMAVERLMGLPFGNELVLEARCAQVTVELRSGLWMKGGQLAEVVVDALQRPPALPLKVVASAHSVDVVAAATTKVAVVDRIRHLEGPVAVLAIGDQGQIGGNDFELLAHERWSLSVDRCSADPSRCWFLDRGAHTGPELLVRYLRALRRTAGGARFPARELL